ncbi:hypothetical protein AB7008_23680 [Bradyrhizobium sp. 521_C7_N1_3]|uniref:hypothetical protein n=1 Tax=Bradyrhizobium sp. 521_C7_N1_3 TaxID=3240368 RepID=UPI003F8C2452
MTTANKGDLVSRKAEAVERTFGVEPIEGLPTTLGAALLDLSKMAAAMHPDDISLSLDLPAGILTFRAYRRERR